MCLYLGMTSHYINVFATEEESDRITKDIHSNSVRMEKISITHTRPGNICPE
jgi:hypothetical protein